MTVEEFDLSAPRARVFSVVDGSQAELLLVAAGWAEELRASEPGANITAITLDNEFFDGPGVRLVESITVFYEGTSD